MFSAGCASVSDSDLPYMVPVGSEIVLTQSIDTRSGSRINIQGGEVAVRGELEIVYPYCLFQVQRTPEEMPNRLVIEEDTFIVTKVSRQLDYIAAHGVEFATGFDVNRSMSTVMEVSSFDANRSMSTVMEISSDRQPSVQQFICVKWGNPTRDQYISLNEMRTALGSLIVLSPK